MTLFGMEITFFTNSLTWSVGRESGRLCGSGMIETCAMWRNKFDARLSTILNYQVSTARLSFTDEHVREQMNLQICNVDG